MGGILIKVAKRFNISTSYIVELLKERGFIIENKPNAKVCDDGIKILIEYMDKKQILVPVSETLNDKKVNIENEVQFETIQDQNVVNKAVVALQPEIKKEPDNNHHNVKRILTQIKERRINEDSHQPIIKNKAIGFFEIILNNKEEKLWLVQNQRYERTNTREMLDGTIRVQQNPNPVYEKYGEKVMSRDSRMATYLLSSKSNDFVFNVDSRVNKVSKSSQTIYNPFKINKDAADIKISLRKSDTKLITYQYRTLKDVFAIMTKIDTEISDIKQQKQEATLASDVKMYLNELRIKEEEKVKLIAESNSFIREQAKLRYQPILDVVQEEIKRIHLFDGKHIIISGGPGTGKTTSLIQRIRFLTDEFALRENSALSESKIKTITNTENPSWFFFSPSTLLYLYLKENMVQDGLLASDKTVLVFSDFRTVALRSYNILKPGEKFPFVNAKDLNGKNLLPNEGPRFQKLIDDLTTEFLAYIKNTLSKILDLPVSDHKWQRLGITIKSFIEKSKYTSFQDLIMLIVNLKQFEAKSKEVVKDLNDRLNTIAATIKFTLEKNHDQKKQITEIFDENNEPDDEELDDFEMTDNTNISTIDETDFKKIRSFIKKFALSKFDKNVSLTAKEKSVLEILVLNLKNIEDIGSILFFKKYFEKLTRGIDILMFNEFIRFYKKYRKAALQNHNDFYNYETLKDLLKTTNNRIHHDEQSLLLGYINGLIKSINSITKSEIVSSKHSFVNGFKTYNKNVIGVDETSDFSLADIYAMTSFLSFDDATITYSGDIMQRTTSNGIKSWEDIMTILPKIELKELLTSYRQGPRLLGLASKIYSNEIGSKPNYKSYLPLNEHEPIPLLYLNNEESEKISWLGKRIIEIHQAYQGVLPSIAIFLHNSIYLDEVVESLNNIEDLENLDLKVIACRDGNVLSTPNSVRVFDVKHIKGLEFEAVFFHNIDQLFYEQGSDLTFKNLYVGLSRATFYLGITANDYPTQMQFLRNYFSSDSHW